MRVTVNTYGEEVESVITFVLGSVLIIPPTMYPITVGSDGRESI